MSRLTIRVIPNASKNEVVEQGAVWKVRLAAPPVDGKANDELIRFLADYFDCAPSEITIMRGRSSKTKIVVGPFSL